MHHVCRLGCFCILVLGVSCATLRPPTGATRALTSEEKAAQARIASKVKGMVVWSSSRFGNHDLFSMNPDGSNVKRLTQGKTVDWFPRFSPDGRRILFVRSKIGWVSEKDANRANKWNLFTIAIDGSGAKKVAENASWGTWIGAQKILFARKTKVFSKDLSSGQETLLVDSEKVPGLGNADLQNPYLSSDGKYLSITLRGAKRETGIFNLESKTWVGTGKGCQVNWFPAGDRILWVNPSGNGGSEVFSVPVENGKPTKEFSYEELRYIDIPGRRSHEYFPQLDRTGKWLVWAATRRGHDHDIADYEIYIWEVGAPADQATRLTFNSANDRWPDIYLTGP